VRHKKRIGKRFPVIGTALSHNAHFYQQVPTQQDSRKKLPNYTSGNASLTTTCLAPHTEQWNRCASFASASTDVNGVLGNIFATSCWKSHASQ